jgi:hypothetical protein
VTHHLRAALLLGATTIATLLAGCGSSGPSDRDQIAAIVKQEGVAPATLCNHLTDALLASLGGRAGCLRQAAAASADPTTRATSVSVHGTGATAVVVNRAGTRTIAFVKERGAWKVAGVG